MTARRLIPALALLFLSAMPAQAGFDWTPAPAAAPRAEIQNADPLMPAMPSVEVEVIAVETNPLAHSTPPAIIETTTIQTTAPSAVIPLAMTPPQSTTTGASSGPVFAEAVGFGSDMPLVLALRQVVPPRYAFAFDPSVDQGARVNWNGGKPWNLVLEETLRPLGLSAQISETTVRIAPAPPRMELTPPPATVPLLTPTMIPPQELSPPVEKPNPVHEVYIRRNGQTSQIDAPSAGMNDALSPAAGGTDIRDEKTPFWNRLGLSAERRPGAVSAPEPLAAPLLTAPENNASLMQPVSLTGDTATQNSSALIKTDKHQGVMDPYAVSFWQAEKGDSLKNVLATWSDSAGVELYWVSTEDYVLPEAIRLHGNYTDAVTNVLAIYGNAAQRPQGRLHPNLPTGPSVLIIEAAQN